MRILFRWIRDCARFNRSRGINAAITVLTAPASIIIICMDLVNFIARTAHHRPNLLRREMVVHTEHECSHTGGQGSRSRGAAKTTSLRRFAVRFVRSRVISTCSPDIGGLNAQRSTAAWRHEVNPIAVLTVGCANIFIRASTHRNRVRKAGWVADTVNTVVSRGAEDWHAFTATSFANRPPDGCG